MLPSLRETELIPHCLLAWLLNYDVSKCNYVSEIRNYYIMVCTSPPTKFSTLLCSVRSFENKELLRMSETDFVAKTITWGLNIGYGVFLILFSLYGTIFLNPIGLIGVGLGFVLVFIAWMYLKPLKKEGWLYALIVNIITIPTAFILLTDPVLLAFPITFAVLIIIIMILPPIRKPYT